MIANNQLFSVHVWAEEIDGGRVEWRGRVNTLPGGTVAYFRTWNDLIQHMQQQLGELTQPGDSHDEAQSKAADNATT